MSVGTGHGRRKRAATVLGLVAPCHFPVKQVGVWQTLEVGWRRQPKMKTSNFLNCITTHSHLIRSSKILKTMLAVTWLHPFGAEAKKKFLFVCLIKFKATQCFICKNIDRTTQWSLQRKIFSHFLCFQAILQQLWFSSSHRKQQCNHYSLLPLTFLTWAWCHTLTHT